MVVENPFKDMNGAHYDRVIPNFFDPDDIEYSSTDKEDYFLFCARLIRRKGIMEAYLTCKEIGAKLIIIGQAGKFEADGSLTSKYPGEFTLPPDGVWEYLGFKGIEERKPLMAHAQALFSPTEYLEAFGGSHVESLLSGTPVITTSFGVYGGKETFIDGLDGFKCDSLDDFCFAARNCKKLDPVGIRKRAERFLMDNVKWEYQKLFEDLYYVYESTLDAKNLGWNKVRTEIPEWRKRIYPQLFE